MEPTLSPDAAAAICRHMNEDHADAIAAYARTFGHIANVQAAQITSIDGHGMQLAVDTGDERVSATIPFDHVLTGSDDARDTLIAMARRAGTV